MQKIYFLRSFLLWIVFTIFSFRAAAETVGVFYDSGVPQTKFAAEEVKAALESKSFTVEMLALSTLGDAYSKKKVVVALVSNTSATAVLKNQNGTVPTVVGEQAYSLRSTTTPQTSYWVLAGDANGAMYGGLQMAENIKFNGFAGTYNNEEAPAILKRGIKLNYPLDANSPTYGKHDSGTFDGVSYKLAIEHVWDINYWKEWFDEMARNRFNVVSLWMCHPFTHLVKLPEYPDVVIPNVTGFNGFTKIMTIDQKIAFWQEVMAYANGRGFDFYFFNWNLFTYGATGKYSITGKVEDAATVTYVYKSMKKLLETYPHLTGFGVTAGEKMTADKAVNEKFLWDTYGKAIYDYALLNPTRKLHFIHRLHWTTITELKTLFQPLTTLSNVNFSVSFKYSQAHMYACATPTFWDSTDENELNANGMKTWFTVRNDDFYYHNWGDPAYARTYIKSMPGKNSFLSGFYMGSDGYCPTRSFLSKNSITQGILDIKRQWYMYMIWGRLAYNPNTSDDVFKNNMNLRYKEISSISLFEAWEKSSRGITKASEVIVGGLNLDFHWWPEGCHFGRSTTATSFITIDDFIGSRLMPGSLLCNIDNSATNTCNGKKSTYQLATEIENDALAAIKLVETTVANDNTEMGVAVNNIKAMSYLTIYYAYKLRAATDKKAANKPAEVIKNLGLAYCWWIKYANLMDKMYYGMTMQRVDDFPHWHHQDANVLKEYNDNGGVGTPNCIDIAPVIFISVNDVKGGTVKGAGVFKFNEMVTVVATPIAGYTFLGWMENDQIVSNTLSYSFNITSDRNLVANFRSPDQCDVPWTDVGFKVNKTTVSKTYGPIDISCVAKGVTISMLVEGVKTDNLDHCKIYYKIDGGAQISMADLNVAFAEKLVSVKGVVGKSLEIIISSATSYNDEFFYVSNIKVSDGATPLSQKLDDKFEVFPNPATQILNLSFPDNQTYRDVRIINSLGQVVYSEKTTSSKMQLDVQSFNFKGMATIQVETDKKVINRKILIQ